MGPEIPFFIFGGLLDGQKRLMKNVYDSISGWTGGGRGGQPSISHRHLGRKTSRISMWMFGLEKVRSVPET